MRTRFGRRLQKFHDSASAAFTGDRGPCVTVEERPFRAAFEHESNQLALAPVVSASTIEISMRPARIAELLQPFLSDSCDSESSRRPGQACPERSRREPAVLSPAQLDRISTYIDLLIRWNSRINLTAIRDPEEIITRHFGESLFAARHLFPEEDFFQGHTREGHDFSRANAGSQRNGALAPEVRIHLADLGSGAGFPGIPIKLWAPAIALALIESNHKKATFLREVVRSLTLTNVDIQKTRAETITQTYDVVTLRAVEHFGDALRVAARLITPTGRLSLLIGSSQLNEAHSTLPQFAWQPPVPVPQSRSRILLMGTAGPIL